MFDGGRIGDESLTEVLRMLKVYIGKCKMYVLFCQLTLSLFQEWKEFYHLAKVDHRFSVSHPRFSFQKRRAVDPPAFPPTTPARVLVNPLRDPPPQQLEPGLKLMFIGDDVL